MKVGDTAHEPEIWGPPGLRQPTLEPQMMQRMVHQACETTEKPEHRGHDWTVTVKRSDIVCSLDELTSRQGGKFATCQIVEEVNLIARHQCLTVTGQYADKETNRQTSKSTDELTNWNVGKLTSQRTG